MRFYEFKNIKEADTTPDELQNMGDTGSVSNYEYPIVPPVRGGLAKRVRGTQILDLQKALTALGYNDQSNVDGIYGPKTANAVKKFQRKNKDVNGKPMAADGDAGPITIRAINKALADAGKTIELSKPNELKPRSGAKQKTLSKPLSTDSVTQGKIGEVLDLIARYESGGDYNIVNGGSKLPLTKMTIAELIDEQRGWRRWRGAASSAAGRYQYIRSTLVWITDLMNIDKNKVKFDAKTQDEICIFDLRYRCRLDDWLAGNYSNEQFLNKLSKVWAAIPNTGTGLSSYQGVANNKAGMSVGNAIAQLDQIGSGTSGVG